MSVAIGKWWFLWHLCRPEWLSGAIFGKELRVASRRRRSYALRLAYVLLLTAYIASVWIPAVTLPRSGAMSRAQMQVAAHTITQGIVWFQFVGAQIVVLLLMSTAISEEVYSRTLGVLMTTPLSSRQVVMNKFVSRLFQVLLLVAVSLPLLALVRVLGGVAWSYLIVSLCVTAATVTFVGSVSLFFSTLCRRAHIGVILSVLVVISVFVLGPVFLGHFLRALWPNQWDLAFLNPYVLLGWCASVPTASGGVVVTLTIIAVAVCLVLLLAARFLLACSGWLLHGVALRRAMGEPMLLDRLRHGRWRDRAKTRGSKRQQSGIRRVVGPPMIWKELTCTLSGRPRFGARMVMGVEILLILIVLLFPAMLSFVSYEVLHRIYIWAFLGLGVLLTIIVSTGVMSTERESRTWPVLLLTPLTDRAILLGKFVGVLRRCGPVWLLLLAYVAGFAYAGFFHPLAIAQVAVVIVTMVLFLSATGFYFGVRLRRATEAVTANLVLAGLLWGVPPVLAEAVTHWTGGRWFWSSSVALAVIPSGQVSFMMIITLTDDAVSQFLGRWELTRLMLISMLGHMLIALVFAWRAVRVFRRHNV